MDIQILLVLQALRLVCETLKSVPYGAVEKNQ